MFELYKKQRAAKETKTVTISSAGVISISPDLTHEYLEDVKYVELYFDSNTKKVGIKPIRTETQYSFQVIRPANGKRAAVSGRGFLTSYKLGVEKGHIKPQKHPAEFDNGMIVFSVREKS